MSAKKSPGIFAVTASDPGKEGHASLVFAAGGRSALRTAFLPEAQKPVAAIIRAKNAGPRSESILGRAAQLSLASAEFHYFSVMKSSLVETPSGAAQHMLLIDTN